jgi:hypothetical protein
MSIALAITPPPAPVISVSAGSYHAGVDLA